jgi:hypothetical protein
LPALSGSRPACAGALRTKSLCVAWSGFCGRVRAKFWPPILIALYLILTLQVAFPNLHNNHHERSSTGEIFAPSLDEGKVRPPLSAQNTGNKYRQHQAIDPL